MDKLCRRAATKPAEIIRSWSSSDQMSPDRDVAKTRHHRPGSPTTSPTPAGNQRAPTRAVSMNRLATMAQIGQDWLYLALLGIIMALLSFSMDSVISLFLDTRLRLFKDLNVDLMVVKYLAWCIMPIILVAFSSGFVHLCSPTVSCP